MFQKELFFKVFFVFLVYFSSGSFARENKMENKNNKFDFTIRLGQGGFSDDRSEIGQLGGGQIALDIKPVKYPFALSIISEYYTNSPDPRHSYEIAGLNAINLLFIKQLQKYNRVKYFLGGGLGQLEVPKDVDESVGDNDDSVDMEKGIVYNLEAGININLFWKIGFYGIGKYLYAQKK